MKQKTEDIPLEVWEYFTIISATGGLVGSKTADRLRTIEEKYPEHFPWEAKYRSIPKEVHSAYINEKYGDIVSRITPINDGRGILERVNEHFENNTKVYKLSPEKEDERAFSQIVKEFFETMQSDMIKEEKERKAKFRKDKALWDKHYKKYGLKFRE